MRLALDHACAVRLSIAAAMVIEEPAQGECLNFSALAELCKEMSTNSKDNAAASKRNSAHGEARRCRPTSDF
jgi:hypothetical protein